MEEKYYDMSVHAMEAWKEEHMLRLHAEAQLEEQEGKVLFADAVNASNESILVRELAVILKQSGVEIGEARLFEWLRYNGYLIRQPSGKNLPTQKSLKLGVIEMKQTVNLSPYGRSSVTRTPKITPKGKEYFFKKVLADKERIHALEAEKKQAAKAARQLKQQNQVG